MECTSPQEHFVLSDVWWRVFALCLPCQACSGDGNCSGFLNCLFSALYYPKTHLKTRTHTQPRFPAGGAAGAGLGVSEEPWSWGRRQQPFPLCPFLRLLLAGDIGLQLSVLRQGSQVSYVGVWVASFSSSLSSLEYSLV